MPLRTLMISRAQAHGSPLRRKSASVGRTIRKCHGGYCGREQLHGKELSYNNLVDLDAAWQLIKEFDSPATAIIKHTNPCGCAEQESLRKAIERHWNAIRFLPLAA